MENSEARKRHGNTITMDMSESDLAIILDAVARCPYLKDPKRSRLSLAAANLVARCREARETLWKV